MGDNDCETRGGITRDDLTSSLFDPFDLKISETVQRHRFHAPAAKSAAIEEAATIELDPDESHHLARVLRLREGDTVFAFNGGGEEWECEVACADRTHARLTVLRQLDNVVESPLRLTLAQALVKGEKFDWIVQKSAELGVSRIVPLITDHGEARRHTERNDHRVERWRRISLEAVKQCGRRSLVAIDHPLPLPDFCRRLDGSPAVIFSERGGHPTGLLRDIFTNSQSLTLIIGPEGGWSAEELDLATTAGICFATLGPRILRAETAAITAIALCQHLLGDMR